MGRAFCGVGNLYNAYHSINLNVHSLHDSDIAVSIQFAVIVKSLSLADICIQLAVVL